MKNHPIHPSSVSHARFARGIFRSAALPLVAACVCIAGQAQAGLLSVPNYSFENPTTTFVTNSITNWTQTDQPGNFNSAYTGGYPWQVTTGIFANQPGPSYIDNLDGTQSAYFFAVPGDGIYQQTSNTYQAGKNYSLTVGVIGASQGLPDGATMALQLYYTDGGGNRVAIGSQTVTENSANFPNHTHAYDYTLNLATVQASDAWAGQQIGIELVATSDYPLAGSYWDVDNVRLDEEVAPVPEPASAAALFALGGVAMQLRRRYRRA
jgi:hypothetical protein